MLDKLPFYGGTKSTARKRAGERYKMTCGGTRRLKAYATYFPYDANRAP